MSVRNYDCSGWATKNDLKCSDGRIIRRNAFQPQDGRRVPLVWNHQHNSPDDVLGHADLENRPEGVYAYLTFNDTKKGQHAKECVKHGDVTNLSIWANNLQQNGSEVLHGVIREVSLVLAGANPGAFIESVVAHGEPIDEYDEEGIFYTDDDLFFEHAMDDKKEEAPKEDTTEKKEGSEKVASGDKTVGEVLKTFNDDQLTVLYAMVGQAQAEAKGNKSDDEEDSDMKHNVFEDGPEAQAQDTYLSHSDMEQIMADAKRIGSLRQAVKENLGDDVLIHAGIPNVPVTGMTQPGNEADSYGTDYGNYGFKNPSMFYPDARALSNTPEFIGRRTDWVADVMGKVKHTPFSRVKSLYANITEDDARAKGYLKKGTQKKYEVFSTLKRVTNPTTIYKLQKLDRDDIIDITDFDVVAWIRGEMRTMLDEEIARAILIGDGRAKGMDEKISEDCIRPVMTDVDLFNIKVDLEFATESTPAQKAKQVIDAVIRAHKQYRGSGNPTFYTTDDWLTEMLLLEDNIGHKLYKTEAELATAMRVSKIVTVELMEGQKIPDGNTYSDHDLIGIIVNLADYNVGQDPKGGTSMFDDFDIDFNQYKYLIETRMSGALVKPFSAITITGKDQE